MDRLPRNRYFIFGFLSSGSLWLDLWSKDRVFAELGLFNRTGWLLDGWVKFELHTNLNMGALWGMGQGFAGVFAALSVVAFVGIIYYLFIRKAAVSLWLTVALSFVTGGTLGNLYDRLGMHDVCLPGQDVPARAVRDFFHFQLGSFDWAIFNVADICLVTGAIMLMIQSMLQPNTASEAVSENAQPPLADRIA
ncbi:MAG: signal peptidase II [Planctomycetaceae bacterium]|nr:signal peptidase II [Planctomycetaceae bacterium]